MTRVGTGVAGGTAAILLAPAALSLVPIRQMEAAAASLPSLGVDEATFAFADHGEPSLRSRLSALRYRGLSEVLILPLYLPNKPKTLTWIARCIRRWRADDPAGWPQIRIGPPPDQTSINQLLPGMLAAAREAALLPDETKRAGDAGIVPKLTARVLVCHSLDCLMAGAPAILHRLQEWVDAEKLRDAFGGVAVSGATCLGPCHLAPVLQVYPGGTYYGGLDDGDVDLIVQDLVHQDGRAAELAYPPARKKQCLRPRG